MTEQDLIKAELSVKCLAYKDSKGIVRYFFDFFPSEQIALFSFQMNNEEKVDFIDHVFSSLTSKTLEDIEKQINIRYDLATYAFQPERKLLAEIQFEHKGYIFKWLLIFNLEQCINSGISLNKIRLLLKNEIINAIQTMVVSIAKDVTGVEPSSETSVFVKLNRLFCSYEHFGDCVEPTSKRKLRTLISLFICNMRVHSEDGIEHNFEIEFDTIPGWGFKA